MNRSLRKHGALALALPGAVWLIASFFGCYQPLDAFGPSAGASDASSSVEAGATTGLPCNVEAVLKTHCTGCHADPPSGAPMALVNIGHLTAKSGSDKTVAQIALERMKDAARPMPPRGGMPAADIAVFAAWIEAGTPSEACTPSGGVSNWLPASDASHAECTYSSDCPGQLVCRSGRCDVECFADKDCAVTWTCENARCQPPGSSVSVDAGIRDGGSLGDAGAVTYSAFATLSWSVAQIGSLTTGTYNGTAFDGRYVYFSPDGASGKVLRHDTQSTFTRTDAWATFDMTTLAPSATGYRGAVFDGRYVYFVPSARAIVPRLDTHASFASNDAWAFFDLTTLDPSFSGLTGATFDGRYVYFVPSLTTKLLTVRLDTHAAFTNSGAWTKFDISTALPSARPFAGAVYDGRYVYYVPWRAAGEPNGVVVRHDTQGGFGSSSSWAAFDLTTLNPKAAGYRTAAFDGRYVYFVPGWTAPSPAWSTSAFARFDTQGSFANTSAWSFFDGATIDAAMAGFNAAIFDGRHVIFTPGYASGQYSGFAARFDTKSAFSSTAAWSMFDMTELDPALSGSKSAGFDGQYMYFAPLRGVAARFETKSSRVMPSLPGYSGSFF